MSIAISQNFFHTIKAGFQGAWNHLIYINQNLTFKVNHEIDSQLGVLTHQRDTYQKEGLFLRTQKIIIWLLIQRLCIIIIISSQNGIFVPGHMKCRFEQIP